MGDREEEACRGDGSQCRCDGGPDLSRHRKKQTYISCPIRTGNLSQMPHGLKAPQRSRDGPLSPCPLFLSYHGDATLATSPLHSPATEFSSSPVSEQSWKWVDGSPGPRWTIPGLGPAGPE